MAEWSKATASKAVFLSNRDRGFESHSLLQKIRFSILEYGIYNDF